MHFQWSWVWCPWSGVWTPTQPWYSHPRKVAILNAGHSSKYWSFKQFWLRVKKKKIRSCFILIGECWERGVPLSSPPWVPGHQESILQPFCVRMLSQVVNNFKLCKSKLGAWPAGSLWTGFLSGLGIRSLVFRAKKEWNFLLLFHSF